MKSPTTARALTTKQQCLLDYIRQCLATEHHWPTTKQAAHDFGVVPNAVDCALKFIEKKGHITRNARGKPMLAGYAVAVLVPGGNTPAIKP